MRSFLIGILFALGIFGLYLVASPDRPVMATSNLPATSTATALPAVTPTITPTLVTMQPQPTRAFPVSATPVDVAKGIILGWTGEVQCWNCAPFSAHVKLSNYNPPEGPNNCWDYDMATHYCYSPTLIGVPWKSVWGFGAACPPEWRVGTWIQIDGVGTFICFDRGSAIVCDAHTKTCNVDILGPGGAKWNQQEYDVTLWVPLDPPREDK
jgi:hypothetical protein